jgi:hypothetical protein
MDIPATFVHQGKTYYAYLSEVSGMAATSWHVMINHFYYGSVQINSRGFVYHTNPPAEQFAYLVSYFEDVLIAWYQ